MSLFSRIKWLTLVAFLLVLPGCGEPLPDGFPKLYPVSIQFIQEGEPVAEASVILMPQDDGKWAVGGATDANGIATFRTHGKHSGVPAGKYKVMIQKQDIVQKPTNIPGEFLYDSFDLIDPNFRSENTPLEIEVISGRNKFDPIDLGKSVRIQVPRIN